MTTEPRHCGGPDAEHSVGASRVTSLLMGFRKYFLTLPKGSANLRTSSSSKVPLGSWPTYTTLLAPHCDHRKGERGRGQPNAGRPRADDDEEVALTWMVG